MNLPNGMTLFRVVLTPVFMILMLAQFPHHYIAALTVFVIASITDALDGQLARRHGRITDFGKFMDPLADKMLTTAAWLCFMDLGLGMGMIWAVIIVLAREFLVTSLRLMAAKSGQVIAASLWGKIKTAVQMAAIIMTIFFEYLISFEGFPVAAAGPLRTVYSVVIWVSVAMTVLSGAAYLGKNRSYLNSK